MSRVVFLLASRNDNFKLEKTPSPLEKNTEFRHKFITQIVKNKDGLTIVAGARNLGENSISVAEALDLRDALWLAEVKGLQERLCGR